MCVGMMFKLLSTYNSRILIVIGMTSLHESALVLLCYRSLVSCVMFS
jgi:hypothetical protein